MLRNRLTPWRFFLPVGPPDAVLKVVLGEVASVIATGQKVLPAKALVAGLCLQVSGAGRGLARDLLAQAPAAELPEHRAPAHAAAHH